MCILLCFNNINEQEGQSLEKLKNICNIPAAEFIRHLLSLCTPKNRILKKSSVGKVIIYYYLYFK
jgi:cullin 3